MITAITVENFKNLASLKLEGLSRITLIGGENNCGKTTLLEAIMIAANRCDPKCIATVFRNLNYENLPDPWNPLFNDILFPIRLTSNTNNKDELFILSAKHGTLKIQSPVPAPEIEFLPADIRNRYITSHFSLSNLIYITSGSMDTTNYIEMYSELHANGYSVKKKRKILELGKFFEPNLSDIVIVSFNNISYLYIVVEDSSQPVSSYGEGFQRFLAIMLHMMNLQDGILLIDEIENGLHHSVMVKVWQAVAVAAREFNCQVIATTHSYECLQAAFEGCKDVPEDLTFIRLDKMEDGTTSPAVFTYDMLNVAIERSWEVR